MIQSPWSWQVPVLYLSMRHNLRLWLLLSLSTATSRPWLVKVASQSSRMSLFVKTDCFCQFTVGVNKVVNIYLVCRWISHSQSCNFALVCKNERTGYNNFLLHFTIIQKQLWTLIWSMNASVPSSTRTLYVFLTEGEILNFTVGDFPEFFLSRTFSVSGTNLIGTLPTWRLGS